MIVKQYEIMDRENHPEGHDRHDLRAAALRSLRGALTEVGKGIMDSGAVEWLTSPEKQKLLEDVMIGAGLRDMVRFHELMQKRMELAARICKDGEDARRDKRGVGSPIYIMFPLAHPGGVGKELEEVGDVKEIEIEKGSERIERVGMTIKDILVKEKGEIDE